MTNVRIKKKRGKPILLSFPHLLTSQCPCFYLVSFRTLGIIKLFFSEPIGKDIYITDIFLDRCCCFFLLNQVSAEIFYKFFCYFFHILDTRNTDGGLTKRFISDLFLQILSYVSEQERENIRSRQRQGIETARSLGKYKGRKPIDVQNFQEVYIEWRRGAITARKAMELLGGIKPNTFYRRVKEYEGTL